MTERSSGGAGESLGGRTNSLERRKSSGGIPWGRGNIGECPLVRGGLRGGILWVPHLGTTKGGSGG